MTNSPLQILLVEDNPADAVLLKKELTESPFGPFTITHVKRLSDAIEQFQLKQIDAVLLDLGLPDSQGIDTLKRMHKEKPREVPIVVLTGLGDEMLGIRAVQEGAEDFLVKIGSSDSMRARSVRYAIERKRSSEAFLASEQRLALAVDAAQMAIFDWNLLTGKITRSHHKALFGLNSDEEFEDSYDAFEGRVHPDDRGGIKAKIEHSLAAREDYNHEFRVIWPDGTDHWLEARGKVFRDDQDRPVRMMGTVVNISERKAAEESARLRESELAHLSRIATMGQMASGLAHELNQPLSAILNYSSVCLEQIESQKASSPTALTAIREVMNETRRAGAIISRMRSFVRKQQPQSVLLDLNTLVRESIRMMEFELRHQRIRPRVELADNLPQVLCDAIQIEQVLVNLIFNALEAMGDAETSRNGLTVQTALDDEGRSVRVCIIDTGSGISAESMARLFEPFFTTKAKGLGMGLNICRSIIESHGGRLSATPNPERGTRFCFTVPVP